MTRIPVSATLASALVAVLLAGPADAACYADYKAKKDSPLQLHYGVAEVGDPGCTREGATAELAPRLARAGWTLLNVLSTFGPEGLEKRKASAGAYYLRF